MAFGNGPSFWDQNWDTIDATDIAQERTPVLVRAHVEFKTSAVAGIAPNQAKRVVHGVVLDVLRGRGVLD